MWEEHSWRGGRIPDKRQGALLSFKHLNPKSTEDCETRPCPISDSMIGNYKRKELLTTKGVGVISEKRYTGIPWLINVVAASRANLEMQSDGGEKESRAIRTVGDNKEGNEGPTISLD